jgi:hypothetical protein
MNKHNIGKILSAQTILWTMVFLVAASCAEKDDATAIRELIKKGVKLAEEHDLNGLIKLTTDDFDALPGHHNRQAVKRIIWSAFLHYGKFQILYPEPVVNLSRNDPPAVAKVHFLIVKKDQSFPKLKELYKDPRRWLDEVGKHADLYRLKLQMLKKNGDWSVKQAHLEGFKGFGF